MPGPSTLYAAAQTLSGGRRAGWMATVGIHLGGYVHVVSAALGLAVVFQTVPKLYVLLKLAGGIYLIWLGIRMFSSDTPRQTFDEPSEAQSVRGTFWESIAVEVLNPKTALFYLAFLPQFTDAAADMPIWAQLLVLGTIVNVMFSSADVFCVLLADKVTKWMKTSRRANRVMRRIGGSLLVGLGINLALSRQ